LPGIFEGLSADGVQRIVEELNEILQPDGYRLRLCRYDANAQVLEVEVRGYTSGCATAGEGLVLLVERRLRGALPGVKVKIL
jgi:Fe-S cluster biogenesis protein NfuA